MVADFDWTGAVSISVAIVLTEVLLAYVLSRRKVGGRHEPSGDRILEYGGALKRVVVALSVAAAVMMGALLIHEPPANTRDFVWAGVSVGAFAVLISVLVVEVHGVSHRVSSVGLERRSPWSRRLHLPWGEVDSIRYSGTLRGYVIRGRGRKIRVVEYLDGFEEFERIARERIPSEKWHGRVARARRGLTLR